MNHRGFGMIELMITIVMASVALFLAHDLMFPLQTLQARLDRSGDADTLISSVESLLRDEELCTCALKDARFVFTGAREVEKAPIATSVAVWNAGCEVRGPILVEKGMRLKGMTVESVTIADARRVTRTRLETLLEIRFKNPMLTRSIPIVFVINPNSASGSSPDVLRCYSAVPGDRLDGIERLYKKADQDEVFIDFSKHADALYALIKIRGTRRPILLPDKDIAVASDELKALTSSGTDVTLYDLMIDLRRETVTGTHAFAGGMYGTLSRTSPLTSLIAQNSTWLTNADEKARGYFRTGDGIFGPFDRRAPSFVEPPQPPDAYHSRQPIASVLPEPTKKWPPEQSEPEHRSHQAQWAGPSPKINIVFKGMHSESETAAIDQIWNIEYYR